MDLITTHINADFDALGSLVAAKKLYPNSRLLLPGSQEKAVREFLALSKDLIIVESEKECDISNIDRLILVDTRHRGRIGIASQLVPPSHERAGLVDKGVEVYIYDHHPRMKEDIAADRDVYQEVGATVTILTDLIRRKRIRLSYLEATIMLLGIYEETGSLTYRTTTKLDVDMVSFLLSQGANLSVVSSYLNRELSEEELSFLTKLINATKRISIKGVSVSIIEIDSESYVGELGMLIHKLMEIENIPVLFVLINTLHGRVDIIGRSSISSVDVNKTLSHFGGGGHPSAASAKVHGVGVDALKAKLLKVLKSNIKVRLYARDIMSKEIKAVAPNERIDATKRILSQEKLTGMPVMEKGRLVGIITLGALNKAMKHGFGHSRVKGYMLKDFVTIREGVPLHDIHKMMLQKDVGILPVVKNRKLVGMINRTALLKRIYNEVFSKGIHTLRARRIASNLSKKMYSVFPKEIMSLLKQIGGLSNKLGHSAFVVGGLVRDLLLGTKNLDLDIVIEGDAINFGKALSQELSGALVVHKRFGTCTVVVSDKLKIDLATARKEVYEAPAALPTVEFSSLKNDLIRRDFTINAMAVSLNEESFGQLIDFFGGESDLFSGRIKVMHDGSFIDDPTRIFRAVRFEQRFGFAIDPHTEELIVNAIEEEMFEKVQPQRIRDEIVSILKEVEPVKALERMAELDEFRFIHPKIKLDQEMKKFYSRIDEACSWYENLGFKKRSIEKWLMYLIALFEPLSYKETLILSDKFVFKRGERLRILSYKECQEKAISILSSRKSLAPSRVYNILGPLSYEVTLLLMARSNLKLVWTRIKDFLERYNRVRIRIRGQTLEGMGLEPGPDFKRILDKVLYKKIDGLLKTKRDELEYAKVLIKKI